MLKYDLSSCFLFQRQREEKRFRRSVSFFYDLYFSRSLALSLSLCLPLNIDGNTIAPVRSTDKKTKNHNCCFTTRRVRFSLIDRRRRRRRRTIHRRRRVRKKGRKRRRRRRDKDDDDDEEEEGEGEAKKSPREKKRRQILMLVRE